MSQIKFEQNQSSKSSLLKRHFQQLILSFVLFFIAGITPVSAQYGPLYWDLRQFDSLPDYRKAMAAFNAQDTSRAFFLLDSIANDCLQKGEKRKYFQARNDQATMLYLRGDYTKSHRLFTENLIDMEHDGDTVQYEFAIALRLLSYLSNQYSGASHSRSYYTYRQFSILQQMADSSEMMVDCTADKAYVELSKGDKRKAIELLQLARSGATRLNMDEPLLRIEHTLVNQLSDEQPDLALDIFENQYLTASREYLKDSIALVILAYTVAEKSVQLEQYHQAIDYYQITEHLLDATGYQHSKLINALPLETAVAYAQLGKREKFQDYIRETMAKTEHSGNKKLYDAKYVHLAIAESFLLFDADSSLFHLGLAAASNATSDTLTTAKIAFLRAKAYQTLNKIDSAAILVDDALNNLHAVLSARPSPFTASESQGLLRDFQMLAAEIYAHKASYDLTAFEPANQAIQAAIQSINQLALLLSNEKDLLRLSADYKKMALLAFDMINQQDDASLSNAWSLLADSKTFQLKRAIQKAKQAARLQAENSKWNERLQAEKQVYALKNAIENAGFKKDDSLLIALRADLKKNQIDLLLANFRLEESVTAPFELIFEPVKINDIQDKIARNECVIDFYLTNNRLLAFAITDDELQLHIYDSLAEVEAQHKSFLRAIKTAGDRQASARWLTNQLITPFKDLLDEHGHIVMIPDGWLFQIPFEALLWPETNDFLVEHTAMSYHYSAFLWQQSSIDKLSGQPSLLAIAPVFEQQESLLASHDSPYRAIATGISNDFNGFSLQIAPLPFTKIEVKKLESIFTTNQREVKVLIGNDANKSNFFSQSYPYEIIHFATHGFANLRTSKPAGLLLAASESDRKKGINSDFLHLAELYSTKTTASLVVLSACNSGAGPMAEAEGVMAIPRAFFYAGIPNVLASLWGVNDRTTATLMNDFYHYLLQGDSFAVSMQKAKIDAIQSEMLPLDWAGFVLVGR